MNTIAAIGWELRRILLTRTYLYSLLLIMLLSQSVLGRLTINSIYGTAPYSRVSYAQFLVLMNGFLLIVLILWCGAIFVLGLSLAVGQLHCRLPYGLIPVISFVGALNVGLPRWLDITGNTFFFNYPRTLMRTFRTGEMVYHLPAGFLATRMALVLIGLALFYRATRRPCR